MGQPGQAPGVDKRLDLSCISTQGFSQDLSQEPGRDLSQGPGFGLLLFPIRGLSQDLSQGPGFGLPLVPIQGHSLGPGQEPG